METMLNEIAKDDKDFNAEFKVFFSRSPLEVSTDELIVRTVNRVHKNILKKEPELRGLSFWTDAALLHDTGIPPVIIGPCGRGLHASVEYVEVDSVISLSNILTGTAAAFCR